MNPNILYDHNFSINLQKGIQMIGEVTFSKRTEYLKFLPIPFDPKVPKQGYIILATRNKITHI
jgi:hypothetical protein